MARRLFRGDVGAKKVLTQFQGGAMRTFFSFSSHAVLNVSTHRCQKVGIKLLNLNLTFSLNIWQGSHTGMGNIVMNEHSR